MYIHLKNKTKQKQLAQVYHNQHQLFILEQFQDKRKIFIFLHHHIMGGVTGVVQVNITKVCCGFKNMILMQLIHNAKVPERDIGQGQI